MAGGMGQVSNTLTHMGIPNKCECHTPNGLFSVDILLQVPNHPLPPFRRSYPCDCHCRPQPQAWCMDTLSANQANDWFRLLRAAAPLQGTVRCSVNLHIGVERASWPTHLAPRRS